VWSLDIPRVIGHRGACAYAPENTLASIRKAAALGARWVEFDVRLTRDGDLVLMHDDTLKRTTDGKGRVIDHDGASLGKLDAGSWFAAPFAGERVPTLSEAIALLAELKLGADIEIKAAPADAPASAAALARILDAHWPAAAPPPLVSSFEVAALQAMKALAPQWPRGVLLQRLEGEWWRLLDRLDAAVFILDHRPMSEKSVSAALQGGRPVLCYTVNEPARARDLLSWGVAGIFTDKPDVILAA